MPLWKDHSTLTTKTIYRAYFLIPDLSSLVAAYVNVKRTKQDIYNVTHRSKNAFELVKEQTREICLVAVQKYGWNLQFVKEQTCE